MTDLIVAEPLEPAKIFTDDGLKGLLQDIESQAMAHVPDVSTKSGRKDIASLAYTVARCKTLIDSLGKETIADWQAKVKRINGYRKTARDFLDELKEKVRQPLTDWEAEQQRIKEEQERKEKEKIDKRIVQLGEYGCILPFQEVAVMSDEEYESAFEKAKTEYEAEQKRIAEEEAARKAEAERLEKIRKEQEAEAERLAKIQAEIEAKEKAIQAEKDRIAHEEAIKKAAEEARIQAEKEAKERAEREAREKAEREKAEAEERKRLEALKPDKDKINYWLESIETKVDETPALSDETAREFVRTAIGEFDMTFEKIRSKLKSLS